MKEKTITMLENKEYHSLIFVGFQQLKRKADGEQEKGVSFIALHAVDSDFFSGRFRCVSNRMKRKIFPLISQ